ncbi:putative ribonuclease H-like domain-containing protein [Tanacetum coccineum]|uniref:Ribonuclease H-like domain-containing protein n=1 Tax=Tanacetum coccineum TaxID=301880 RepID=A0ABQ5DQ27_9ASTR
MYTFSPMMVANSRKHHCRVRSYTREVLVISTNLDIQKNHYPLDFRNRRGDEARIKNTWYNQGSRPNWLFDIDALTKSMNYNPVVTGNQSNGNVGTKACDDEGKARVETDSPDDGFKALGEEEKKDAKDPGNESGNPPEGKDSERIIGRFSDAKDDGAEADMTNLDTHIPVSPILTTRIHKDHPPKKVIQALKDPSWIEAMQDELLQFKLQQVWTLVDLPYSKRVIGTKWVYKNKKDERGIVIRNKARLVAQGHTQEEGIDYDEVFALVARIEAIRLFLAYASYKDFMVYQMDVKSAFLYGKIEEELSELDDIIFGSTKKKLCTEFEKMMHKKFQMSSMGELTFFLGLQVKQKEDGIFISQDKYVTEILKKFGFSDVKTASTPMETHKPLLKDADGEDIDEHILDRKSTTGGCQFLGCRLILWQCKKQTVVANSTTEAEYIAASNCFKNPVFHSKTKHIEIRHHFIRDSNEKKLIQMVKIHTYKNVADLLTKAFDKGIGVNAGDSKLMPLSINLLLLEKVNAARHNLLLLIFYAKEKMVNGEVQLQALVYGKKIVDTEASIRRDLQLEDANGVDCLPNATIFEQLTLMGYEKISQKLTFYKAFFSPQWKFLIHTILQCLSAKTTAWNEFSSTMASAIICLATNQKFNFSKYIFESMMKNLDSAVKFLMYPRFVQVFLDNQLEGMINHNRIYIAPSHTKKVFANMKRQGKDFSGRVTPLFSTMMVQAQQEQGEDETVNEENVSKHSNDPLLSVEDRLKLKELMALCTNLQNMVLDLEHTKITQALEIDSLKRRVKKLEKKQRSRTHGLEDYTRKIHDIDADEDITLENVHDEDMFDTSVFNDEEVFVGQDMAEKDVSTADLVTTAGEVVTTANVEVSIASLTAATITTVELTLAQIMAELKSVRPKTKGVVMQEPSESITTITIPSKDKGKDIMVEEPLKMKKKDQVETDYELAQRLQAEEQEELTIEEKSKLFQQLLEKRRKHFAAKIAEERRNRPPIKAQQISIMCTYLKNMAGWKPKDLKTKSFANVQELFDKAMKRVNTFVDMDTELVRGSEVREDVSETREERSSKRTDDELEQEPSKKQKMEDDKATAELQSMMEVIPDEEEVAVDAIPLATKPPSIVDWKIIKEGKIGYYQIIRADGNSKRYSSMIQMLKSFDREDLETLWKLVKAKHGYTRPEEGYERVLWEAVDSQSTQTIKLPILQPGEYDLWKMRMEQYLQCIDYTLWEIIKNDNAPIVTKTVDGKETGIPPTSIEEKAQTSSL